MKSVVESGVLGLIPGLTKAADLHFCRKYRSWKKGNFPISTASAAAAIDLETVERRFYPKQKILEKSTRRSL